MFVATQKDHFGLHFRSAFASSCPSMAMAMFENNAKRVAKRATIDHDCCSKFVSRLETINFFGLRRFAARPTQ
jgi:hypothetical protein